MDNLQFITFVVNVMAAVHRHNALIKASIMSATNAHRLGANEAPPAIISIFTGSQLAAILDQLEKDDSADLSELKKSRSTLSASRRYPKSCSTTPTATAHRPLPSPATALSSAR